MKKATKRLLYLYLFLLFMALSLPSVAYWLPLLILTLLLGFGYVSANLAKNSLQAEQFVHQTSVQRGDTVEIQIGVSSNTILPIAPIKLCIKDVNGEENIVEVNSRTEYASFPFLAMHVGRYNPGIEYCKVRDIFGLFEYQVDLAINEASVNVIPRVFDTEEINFGAGDMGAETIKRAQEDLSSPEGIRKYQMGDPLKKIHWKLSLRKQEIVVRQYEEPTLPSLLILMDVAPPHVSQNANAEIIATLKDAVLETAASIAVDQIRLQNKVKLPILGSDPFVFLSSMGTNVLLERLSAVAFDETERFERFLFYEMANIKQAGAVIAITTRLSSNLVEVLSQLVAKGPVVRIYLVSFNAENPAYQSMIAKLKSRQVEVRYIIPEQEEYEEYYPES